MTAIDRLVIAAALRFVLGALAGTALALAATGAFGLSGIVPFAVAGALAASLGAAGALAPLLTLRSEIASHSEPGS